MSEKLKIMSMNCRGLGDTKKRTDVLNFLSKKEFSIYCLQDTHWNKKLELKIEEEWNGKCFFSHKNTQSRGTAILFNNNLDFEVHECKSDQEGNWVILDITIEDYRFTFITIYGPNEDTPAFYTNLAHFMENIDNPHILICGDWNLTKNQGLDNFNYLHINNPNAKNKVLSIIDEMDLLDPWRTTYPLQKKYTWRRTKPVKQARLDFFLISKELISSTSETHIIPGYRTDHSGITITLYLNIPKRGKGYWKFNNSLLSEPTYVKKVKDKISELKMQYASAPYKRENIINIPIKELQLQINDQLFFEVLCMEVRGLTISFSTHANKERNRVESKLLLDIDKLEKEVNISTNVKLEEDLGFKRNELADIRKHAMEGLLTRTKAKWIEHGEKPTKFFLNLEKKIAINKQMKTLTLDNGTVITDQAKIIEETRRYYELLYANKDRYLDLDSFDSLINKNDITSLDDVTSTNLNGPLEYKEVLNIIKETKNNKSPGMDGFTYEFYEFFWSDLSYFLIRSLNFAYENGCHNSVAQRR
jgi:exonuclease III